MKYGLLLAALFITVSTTACGGSADDPVADACERLDECNALNDGISVNECVENVDRDLGLFTESERTDWEGLMRSCLNFSSCDLFLSCVDSSGL